MRPKQLVARVALTAALALVALPGIAGSRTPTPERAIEAAAFEPVNAIQAPAGGAPSIGPLDPADRSASFVEASASFVEPGEEARPAPTKAGIRQPASQAASDRKPPRFTLRGIATFYDNGTTAMRLPRGTRVVICGGGGCIERVVNDYGPQKPERVVDLYRPDFFEICGCGWWAGTTNVTVYVY